MSTKAVGTGIESEGRSLAARLEKPLAGLLFFLFLYLFILSIQWMGDGFKMFGAGFAEGLIRTTSTPLVGLFIGLLATSVAQSSSLTTSITVGLVASGMLTLHNAIPIIMGANIGTTVTNILVSLGHINRRDEFERAFGASTVHDFFNVLTVILLFPLEYYTGYLEKTALRLGGLFDGLGGLDYANPLKATTEPVAQWLSALAGHNGWVIVVLSLLLLFLALAQMVKYMKRLIMDRAEVLFGQVIFRTPLQGALFGLLLTSLVQSSSVTTSLVIPLAGAGMLKVEQIFPYTLGANIGTTVTALLAALALGETAGVCVALTHSLFNLTGTLIFWWLPFIPIGLAKNLAHFAARQRVYAILYIILAFFALPLGLIYLLR